MRLRAKNGRDLLRGAMLIQVEELRAQREALKVELKATHAQRDGLRIGLDTVKVRETLLTFASKGRKPHFLEQYEGLKRAGIDMPVLARRQRSEDLVPGHQTERAVQSFEDLNRKIINTLNAFRGSTSTEDVFEVDRYFRAVTDAAAAPQKQLAKREAAETALREARDQVLEEFCRETSPRPLRRHSSRSGPSASTAAPTLTFKPPDPGAGFQPRTVLRAEPLYNREVRRYRLGGSAVS